MVSLTQTLLHKIKKKYYPPLMFEYSIEDIDGVLQCASFTGEAGGMTGDDSITDEDEKIDNSKGGMWFNRFNSFETEDNNATDENIEF